MSAGARRRVSAEPSGSAWVGAGRINGGTDVARVLAAVNATGQSRERTAEMSRAVDRAGDVILDRPTPAVSYPWPVR